MPSMETTLAAYKTFENAKAQCLGKRDKSFAGRIDVKAVEICSVLNERVEYYTTSSCAGRCFLYRGHGIKSTTFLASDDAPNTFQRWRICHDLIRDEKRYFDLGTLVEDPTGGGDQIRDVGQFDHAEQVRRLQHEGEQREEEESTKVQTSVTVEGVGDNDTNDVADNNPSTLWLRFEPFILHVCARSLSAASALMNVARPSFKNVGLTTWKSGKYLVAIWGDEGLDMPLTNPSNGDICFSGHERWLGELVNERHERNWSKIDRFVQAVRAMPVQPVDENDDNNRTNGRKIGSFDVVGDVALVYSVPETDQEKAQLGDAILNRNKAIKVVALRTSNLSGSECAPGEEGMEIIAGSHRRPLITTHTEYGIKCIVDLNKCFFSPRMAQERLRVCQQVARGEKVLVLFAGVGMEALQIVGRTEAAVEAIEMNPVAVKCMILSRRVLERSKAVKCVEAAKRLMIVEGDVLEILPKLKPKTYDRILAPRPKEGSKDGDLGTGDFGAPFLDALLPLLKTEGGTCHWYDFAADHEFPVCERTRKTIQQACSRQQLVADVYHVANAGSVAMRQMRVCADFRLCGVGNHE